MTIYRQPASDWTMFETAIGVCAVAWREDALSLFLLPDITVSTLRERMAAATDQNQPSIHYPNWMVDFVTKVSAHMSGYAQDFSSVRLNLESISKFKKAVYAATQKIPLGEVRTYGEIAAAIGRPKAARAVGTALGQNPIALVIPCHRVLGGKKRLGGFSAFGGLPLKQKLLTLEGVQLSDGGRFS